MLQLEKIVKNNFVRSLAIAGSLFAFDCSKDSNPVAPRTNSPPETYIEKMELFDNKVGIICHGVRIWMGGRDDAGVDYFEVRIDNGEWEKVNAITNKKEETEFKDFSFFDDKSHIIEMRAVDIDGTRDPTPLVYSYVYQNSTPPVTPPVTTEQEEMTTGSTTGFTAFYSDMDKKYVSVKIVDKNGSTIPIASDVKYYSDLEQIVAVSVPKDTRYLPSLYIENRTSTDLAGIKEGVISLVTYTLSETKYKNVSIKLYNDLPNLFQNKTIIPGLLTKTGDWSFNDIKNGNYWINQTSKILIPLTGGFTTPIVAGTEASGNILNSIDDIIGYIEFVSGKKIDRDQKIGWYRINIGMLSGVDIPNLIPFFMDVPTQTFNAPTSYDGASLYPPFSVDTVGVRKQYSNTWESWSVNLVLDSKYSSIKKYAYFKNNAETFGFTVLTFGSPERAEEFNNKYLGSSIQYMSNVYYFPNAPELKDVYYFRNGVEVPARDYLVFFFPVKNFWIGMDVYYGTPNLESAGIGLVKEIRRLNP